jgi:hypothetical protein
MSHHNSFEVEIAIAKLKKYKLSGSDQIPVELIQAGGETVESQIHKFINCIWSKEELPDQHESSVVPVYKKGGKTYCSNYRVISLLSTSYKKMFKYPLKVKSIRRRNYWGPSVWVST